MKRKRKKDAQVVGPKEAPLVELTEKRQIDRVPSAEMLEQVLRSRPEIPADHPDFTDPNSLLSRLKRNMEQRSEVAIGEEQSDEVLALKKIRRSFEMVLIKEFVHLSDQLKIMIEEDSPKAKLLRPIVVSGIENAIESTLEKFDEQFGKRNDDAR